VDRPLYPDFPAIGLTLCSREWRPIGLWNRLALRTTS